MTTATFWSELGVLFAVALLGGLAVMPYSVRLVRAPGRRVPRKMSVQKFLFLSFFQTAILSAIVIGVGLLAAHPIGLGAPHVEAAIEGRGAIQPLGDR